MISIIIASYNQEEFLPDAIESALGQTQECEVIVIDDGSTDHSLEIARKYPVKLIRQVNKGLPSARNTGIMNAKGSYVLPLDADDILLPDCISTLEEVIEETSADIVAPSFKCFGVANNEVILDKQLKLESFKDANRIAYCSAIFRSALLEIGGYSPKMVWGWEDYHMWINLLLRGKKIVTIQDILLLYRTKRKSMWTESVKHEKELRKQIEFDFPELYA